MPWEFFDIISTHKIFNISCMKIFDWLTMVRNFNVYTVAVKPCRMNFPQHLQLLTFIGKLLVFM